jgi:2,5-dihydroxypyridine 5,6-dioxygenase
MRAYHDSSVTGLTMLELAPGASNLADYLAINHDDEVMILAEYAVPESVINALGMAARLRGARVSVLIVEPFSPGGSAREIPSPIVAGAWRHASVVISCTWWAELHSAPLFFSKLGELNARLAALHQTATPAALAAGARFPPPVFYEIKSRVLEQIVDASEIGITTRTGTDLRMRDIRVDTDNGPLVKPGVWSPFPYGGVNWYPADSEGVLMLEENTVTGVPAGQLRVELSGNRVVDIDSSREGRDLEAFSPEGYYLRHAFIGLNPKVRMKNAPQFEREKHAGAFYLGLDSLTAAGRSIPGHAHCDCQFDHPTVTVDGETIVDEGYLLALDHPQVRATAARYGRAETLLLPNPDIW